MHTTIAYAEANTPDGTFQKVSAVPDQHIKVYGEKIYVGDFDHIIGAGAFIGVLALEARIISPSLRRVNPYYIAPLTTGIFPQSTCIVKYHPQSPVRLDRNEAIEVEVKATGGAAREIMVGMHLAQGGIPPLHGEIFTVNCAWNCAIALHVWTYSEITFPDSLPVGNYKVVGARCVCDKGVLFRMVPIGEAYRPGGIIANEVNRTEPENQRFGGLGHWFTFNTVQPPGIEVAGNEVLGAAAHELYLDVIKI